MGGGGDGVVERAGGAVFVPFALPGETVLIEREGDRGVVQAIEDTSADRIAPFCPHYGRCGGCVAQHIGPGLYGPWKRGKVEAALAWAGLADVAVEPLADAAGAGRRRLTFHAREQDGVMSVGFMEARSHRLVPIERCPVASPDLAGAAAAARTLAADLRSVRKPLDIVVTASQAGLDISVRGSGRPGEAIRQRLIARAAELDLARLSLHHDVLIERRPPIIAIGGTQVVPPPGGFLQATAAGETILADAVVAGTDRAGRVADLFSGIGPFALRLAAKAEVHAVESDAAMLASLDRAARHLVGARRVTIEERDLFRRPLLPVELDRFDALVLDPPRAGAEAQIRQVVLSSLETVVMVSCDPGTFARDAATLVGGGFAAERVMPVDQFAFSAHVEIVGVFRRPPARRVGRKRR